MFELTLTIFLLSLTASNIIYLVVAYYKKLDEIYMAFINVFACLLYGLGVFAYLAIKALQQGNPVLLVLGLTVFLIGTTSYAVTEGL